MEHEGQLHIQLWCLHPSYEHFQQQGPGESWGLKQTQGRGFALPKAAQILGKTLPLQKQPEQNKCASLNTQTGKSGVYFPPILSILCSN